MNDLWLPRARSAHRGRRPPLTRFARRAAAGTLALVLAAAARPAPAGAQGAGPDSAALAAKPELSSSSAEAKQAFAGGLEDAAYIFGSRAAERFASALALDSTFGLARVFHAAFAPDYDDARRNAEAARGVADAARGSTGELLLAAANRELIANRPAAAAPLFRALADMYPGEARYAMWAATDWAGTRSPGEVAEAFREVTRRFPDYGAAYNTLAYTLLASGDSAGAVAAARKQVELAPDQPNPHDSYAELLQWRGELDEAATHYAEATRIAPTFTEGYVGIAEVRQLQGRRADARTALGDALRRAVSLDDSLRYMAYVAQSHVYGGDDKAAARALAALARLAEARGSNDRAARAHRDLAVLAAMTKDRKAIPGHLAAARRLGKPDDPRQVTMAALAYATAGMADSLRATAAGQEKEHLAQALVLLRDGRPDDALRELAQADTTARLTQALSADAHAQLKHPDVARAARRRLLDRRDGYFNAPDLRDAAAVRRAGKG